MLAHRAEQERQEEELRMLRQQRDLLKTLLQQQKQVKTAYLHVFLNTGDCEKGRYTYVAVLCMLFVCFGCPCNYAFCSDSLFYCRLRTWRKGRRSIRRVMLLLLDHRS